MRPPASDRRRAHAHGAAAGAFGGRGGDEPLPRGDVPLQALLPGVAGAVAHEAGDLDLVHRIDHRGRGAAARRAHSRRRSRRRPRPPRRRAPRARECRAAVVRAARPRPRAGKRASRSTASAKRRATSAAAAARRRSAAASGLGGCAGNSAGGRRLILADMARASRLRPASGRPGALTTRRAGSPNSCAAEGRRRRAVAPAILHFPALIERALARWLTDPCGNGGKFRGGLYR